MGNPMILANAPAERSAKSRGAASPCDRSGKSRAIKQCCLPAISRTCDCFAVTFSIWGARMGDFGPVLGLENYLTGRGNHDKPCQCNRVSFLGETLFALKT